MGISFKVENWADIKGEVSKLFPEHWQELANNKEKIILEPNYEAYDELNRLNMLHIITVRDKKDLVGYYFTLITYSLHYKSTLMSVCDMYYLKKEFRKGMNGVKLFRFVEDYLRSKKVTLSCVQTKINDLQNSKKDNSPIFKRLGYKETEKLYTKLLD